MFFKKWGAVGESGLDIHTSSYASREAAIKAFEDKFKVSLVLCVSAGHLDAMHSLSQRSA